MEIWPAGLLGIFVVRLALPVQFRNNSTLFEFLFGVVPNDLAMVTHSKEKSVIVSHGGLVVGDSAHSIMEVLIDDIDKGRLNSALMSSMLWVGKKVSFRQIGKWFVFAVWNDGETPPVSDRMVQYMTKISQVLKV